MGALWAEIADRLGAVGGAPGDRKGRGAIYTPADLADFVVARALAYHEPSEALPTVFDPACGSGHFLVAAWKALRGRWRQGPPPVARLGGLDVDPEAVARCRETLALCAEIDRAELGCPPAQADLSVGDALLDPGPEHRADLVVGNPPYVRVDRLEPGYRARLAERFGQVLGGKWDLYLCFLARGRRWLAPGGVLAFVTPNQYLLGASAERLRRELASSIAICEILDCCGLPSFTTAIPPAAISVFRNQVPSDDGSIRAGVCLPPARRPGEGARWGAIRQQSWREGPWSVFAPDSFRRWLDRLDAPLLGDRCGRLTEGDTRRDEEALIRPADEAPLDWLPVVRGRNVLAGRVQPGADRLPPRAASSGRVLVRDVAARLVAAPETTPVRCLRTVYCAHPDDPAIASRLAALLNSDLMTWIYLRLFYSSKMSPQRANFRFQAQFLRRLPILLPPAPLDGPELDAWALEAYGVEPADRAEIGPLLERLGALAPRPVSTGLPDRR